MLSRLAPLAKLTRNSTLRRCGIGFALFNAAEYGEWIAVLVYAYNQGGAKASGILAAAQLLPCVVIAPLLATFADRYQAGWVLVAGYAAQAVGMGLLAIALLAHAPPAVVYVFAILAAPAFNATRPTMNVVLPAAVHTPDELTAGNAALGWIESAGIMVGPVVAAGVIAIGGPGWVVAAFAVAMLVATWVSLPLDEIAAAGRTGRRGLADRGHCRRVPRAQGRAWHGGVDGRAHLPVAVPRRDGRAVRRARDQRARHRAVGRGHPERHLRRRRPGWPCSSRWGW